MFKKDIGTRGQIANNCWIIGKAREFQKKHLLHWLHYSLWLGGSQQTVEDSKREGNSRPPYLSPQEALCRTRSNSLNWTWKNGLVQNWERSTSILYVVTLLHAEHIMQDAGLDESPAEIKIVGRNINNLNHAVTIRDHPNGRKQRGTKEPLIESERGKLKSWLKIQHSKNWDHGIRSTQLMVNRWRNNGNSNRLFFYGSKITADGDCNQEIKRCLLLERKAMTNPDSILKIKNIVLPTNVCIVKAMVFPVVMYGYESWTIKKAECQRIDAFELWCWGRLLRIPRTARRSNLSILKEISPEYPLEGLMLKLKL